MSTVLLLDDVSVLSDEELVRRVWDADERALPALLERYRGFVRSRARSYFLAGGDHEDVVQEGMVGLYKAVRDFDPSRERSFRGFAELCVLRQIITAVKTATRQKHSPLNRAISLSSPVTDDSELTLGDVVGVDHHDPLEEVLQSSDLQALRVQLPQLLSSLEREVLARYVAGDSYAEIAEALARHIKSVDNALQRVKRKLDHYLADRALQAV